MFRTNLICVLLAGGLTLPSLSLAVSRVGGGTLSNKEEGLHSLAVPAKFKKRPQVAKDDSVFLPGPLFSGPSSSGVITQSIVISILRNELPDLGGVTDRAQFGVYLQNLGWMRLSSGNPCLEVFSQPTASQDNWIVGWGDGRGLILSGPLTLDVRGGIISAIESIVIEQGMCGWK